LVAGFANLCMPKYSFQVVGNYSYSLYLIHFPLLSAFFKLLAYFNFAQAPVWLILLIGVLLCNCFAYFIWRYFELPVTNFLRDKLRS
jgi:peptidoglycan/LPS O-acetylase OafA/YrhL